MANAYTQLGFVKQADGENIGTTPMDMTVLPSAVRLLV